jgi:hypothetical protein
MAETRQRRAVETYDSPVIQFARSVMLPEGLCPGRIWAEMIVHDSEGNSHRKGSDFEAFYDSLAKWIRKHYRRESEFGFYVGPAAWEWHERGGKFIGLR